MSQQDDSAEVMKHKITVETKAPTTTEYWYSSRDGVKKEVVDRKVGQIEHAECTCGETFSSVYAIENHLNEVYEA